MHFTIRVSDDSYRIGAWSIESPPPFELLKRAFGASRSNELLKGPDRQSPSTIHTFDDVGVWIYEEAGIVDQVSVLLADPVTRCDFHPVLLFDGDLIIKGRRIEDAADFFAVEAEGVDLNEWETEGAAAMTLGRVRCHLWANSKSGRIQDISLCFA